MYGRFSSIRLPFRCIRRPHLASLVCLLACFLPCRLTPSLPLSTFCYLYYLFNDVVVVVTVIVVAAVVVGFVNSAVTPCGVHVYSRCSLILFVFHARRCVLFLYFTFANKGNYKIDGNDGQKKETLMQTI